MKDLYPRQATGFVIVMLAMPALGFMFVIGQAPAGHLAWSWTVLLAGIGLGMLSGNTRTKRVPGNRGRR